MQNTEVIDQVDKGFSFIINQINLKLTIDADIMKTSRHIDLLLEKLMANHKKND